MADTSRSSTFYVRTATQHHRGFETLKAEKRKYRGPNSVPYGVELRLALTWYRCATART